jgi:hypothetical protein
MDRTIRIDLETLWWGASLAPADRIRQASVAVRLYHRLHRPYAHPFIRGFDTLEEFFAFTPESDRRS